MSYAAARTGTGKQLMDRLSLLFLIELGFLFFNQRV